MPDLKRYLLTSERLIFSVRPHGAALAGSTGLLLLFWAGGVLALWIFVSIDLLRLLSLGFLLLTLAWYAWIVGDWYVERIVVTDRRVLLVTGVVTRRVAIMPLVKVTDLTFEQSLAGRALDFGAFVLESAGQVQALNRIDFLPDPYLRYQQVTALLFGDRADIDPEDLPDTRNTQPVPYVPPRGSRRG